MEKAKRQVLTIFDYLFEKRMKEAEKLLRETDLHIYQIAEKVGFSDYNYFTKIFKKFVGCTPSQYRKLKNKGISL